MLLPALLPLALAFSVIASPVAKSAHHASSKGCKVIKERKEWRALDKNEKKSYIDAVKCLKKMPPAEPNPYEGVKSLYDHFQAVHITKMLFVHWAGQFLPWHRYYIKTLEDALETCGYSGGHPYWSWQMDVEAGSLEQNEMFSDVDGFGPNGVYVPDAEREPRFFPGFAWPLLPANTTNTTFPGATGGGCVPSGPFSTAEGWWVNVGFGPTTAYNPHCLIRDFNFDILSNSCNASVVEHALSQPDFDAFTVTAEGFFFGNEPSIHGGGHLGIGGEMANVHSSPGDPLFYMHHENLDRIWAKWQSLDPKKRLHEVGSNIVSLDYKNTLAGNVTLGFEIDLEALAPPITLGRLLDTEGPDLCFRYIDPPSGI